MGRNIEIDARLGGGAAHEILFGEVTIEATAMHQDGTKTVFPGPKTYGISNGVAVLENVDVSPAGPVPAWAYRLTFRDHQSGKGWSEMVGVPTGTTAVKYPALPRFTTAIPPETTRADLQNWVATTEAAKNTAVQAAATATAPTDAMVAGKINDPASATATALKVEIDESVVPVDTSLRTRVNGLDVRNPDKLSRWSAALGSAHLSPAVITVLGDSITEGVGSDGTAGGTGPNAWEVHRQNSWAVILRKLMARAHGIPVAENVISLSPRWGYATLGAGTTVSSSTGAYGNLPNCGGISVALSTATIPASKSGRFTALDVFYWGNESGVSGANIPGIDIDGVNKYTHPLNDGTQGGNLNIKTIMGLTDSTHEIVLSGRGYIPYVVPRFDTGVVVNRIGVSGASTTDAKGTHQRHIDSAVMRGYTDLLILALGTNDHGAQTPIATFKANLQVLIDAAVAGGASVLLVGEPPSSSGGATAIKESEYRTAMVELSDASTHVAYLDLLPVFRDRNTAWLDGMWPSQFTVHPSRKGHRLMAKSTFDALPLASI